MLGQIRLFIFNFSHCGKLECLGTRWIINPQNEDGVLLTDGWYPCKNFARIDTNIRINLLDLERVMGRIPQYFAKRSVSS